MISRVLSAGLAAAMVIGLASEAWAQSATKPGRRQRKTAKPAATADESPAAGAQKGTEPESSSGSSQDSAAKDPFDAAAKAKGAGTSPGDSAGSSAPKLEQATFGAGCFWHVEHDFEWLPGVKSAISGYSGGQVANPSYEMVHEGDTGHAEVVQVTYDPSIISYEQLLKVFWNAHDPTQWNRQGPDVGPQYRSVIFFHSEAQRKAALKSYEQLVATRRFRSPIVTQLQPMKAFYRAEEYHQNYYGGKDDRPIARSSRSRRTAKSAAGKGTAATAGKKATPTARGQAGGQGAATAKPKGDNPTGGAPATGSTTGPSTTEP
jgi:peptide-methionine (S)-S-oxide reductase